jgi:hypothetical protein
MLFEPMSAERVDGRPVAALKSSTFNFARG